MRTFYKEFLLDESPGGAPGPHLSLAVFGKHPAWNDHLDDISLETPSLIATKKMLYTDGIGGQLDSGAWEKVDPAQRLDGFHHVLLWVRGDQAIAGRLWRSRDGKGRTHYPMCACAQSMGIPGPALAELALAELARVEQETSSTARAEEVCGLVAESRERLLQALTTIDRKAGAGAPEPHAELLAGSLPSVLRKLRENFAAFRRGRFKARSEPRAQSLRLPGLTDSPAADLACWLRVLHHELDPAAPLLLLRPVDRGWVDLIAGPPGSSDFFCLRAGLELRPIVSAKPTDQEYAGDAQTLIDRLLSPGGEGDEPGERGWFGKLFGS